MYRIGKGSHDGSTERWDAIVIGSGVGGMSAAAALSRTGHRVLLLERHERLGGLTRRFSRNGFTWDIGVHYLGGLAPGESGKRILDWLSETPIELASLGPVFDTLHLGTSEPIRLAGSYEAYERDLAERFPDEAQAIGQWTGALRQGRDAMITACRTRVMPPSLSVGIRWWKRRALRQWCERTTEEVARSLTDDDALVAALTAQWGDCGGRPAGASFAMHALVTGSFLDGGAWYPVGGGSVIAERLLPTIATGGGEARAGTEVESLLVEKDRVVGVVTTDGNTIRSDVVVSDIGARETVDRLLPRDHGHERWAGEVRAIGANIAHFALFLGFEGDIEVVGATRSNHWIYPSGAVGAVWSDAPRSVPPSLFLSFGSSKDPTHDPGRGSRHVGELLAWTDWSVVERWAGIAPGERNVAYDDFKRRVEEAMFAALAARFPRLARLVVHRELATPLSTVSTTEHHRGAFYGLDVTPMRVLSNALRPKTPIDGLYLAGQDVGTPGIAGAMWGGLLAAASIEPKVLARLRG